MTVSPHDFLDPDDRPPEQHDGRSTGRSRARGSSGLVAMVAVICFVLVWWLLSGNGPRGPEGNDPVLAVPDVDASGETGDGVTPVPVALSNGLRLSSYEDSGDGRLTLQVVVPPDTCAEVLSPRLVESEVSVTVTATHSTEPDCRPTPRALTETVSVRLDSPLDGRAVLDGALAQQVRVEPAS